MIGRLGPGLLLVLLLLPPAALQGANFVVTKTDDTGDGACGADCSLREAVEAANTTPGPDEITVPAGDYLIELGELQLEDDVEITGAGDDVTTLDAGFASSLVRVHDGVTADLSGLTFTRGNSDYYDPIGGGAISNLGTLTLTDSTIRYSDGGYGGGISSEGSLTLTNSTVEKNYSFGDYSGGGIRSYGSLTLTNTRIIDNYAINYYGAGGILADAAVVDGSTISYNGSFAFAGGIDTHDLTLTSSTVSGNRSAEDAGGITNVGTLVVVNSVIRDNNGGYYPDGGGILNYGIGTLVDSTVTGNSSPFGGGIVNLGTLTLKESSVTANEAFYVGGIANGSYYGDPCPDCVLLVEGSTIAGNESMVGGGGGLQNLGHATLTNTTVSGNLGGGPAPFRSYELAGGAILNGGTLRLTHTTIAGNEAVEGGAIGNTMPFAAPCPECVVEIQSSIIAANLSTDGGAGCVGEPVTSLGHNVIDDPLCGFGGPGDQLVADALLGPLEDNGGPTPTHALLDASPALDAIPIDFCVDHEGAPVLVDQRGAPRPGGVACDAGAYELVPPLEIRIDIRPRSDDNLVNPSSTGRVGVAVLGSADFDVSDVEIATLAFGPDGATPEGPRAGRRRDVDGDGFEDLVSHYRTRDTGIASGDVESCLTGETFAGVAFRGCDRITTVPLQCGLGFLQAAWVLPVVWLRRRARYRTAFTAQS